MIEVRDDNGEWELIEDNFDALMNYLSETTLGLAYRNEVCRWYQGGCRGPLVMEVSLVAPIFSEPCLRSTWNRIPKE